MSTPFFKFFKFFQNVFSYIATERKGQWPSPTLNGSSLCDTKEKTVPNWERFYGAGDEARTRYLHLGKVALYRMSYTRNGHDVL